MKHIVLLVSLLPAIAGAKAFDSSVCFQDKSEKLNLYRDDTGYVRCAHFGRGRVVEYSYATQDQEIDGKKYVQGALVGKKFHGMKHLAMNGATFGPNTSEFQDGLVQEILLEINDLKTLPMIIQEFYPSIEERQSLVLTLLKDQKLSEELDPDWLKDLKRISTSASANFFQNRSERKTFPLDSDGESSIVSTLTANFNNQVSVQQCNEFTFDNIAMRVVAGVVNTTTFTDDPTTMGETWVVEKIANIFLSPILFSISDKTIFDSKSVIPDSSDQDIRQIKITYFRNENFSPINEYKNVSLLSRILVHEMGHARQFELFSSSPQKYKLDVALMNLAVNLADETKFPMIPVEMKKKIQEQIVDRFKNTIEFAAESYFVDAVPCVL